MTSEPAPRPDEPPEGHSEHAPPPSLPPRSVDSDDLLDGRSEVLIRHRGDVYRLRLTRSGKLILHK